MNILKSVTLSVALVLLIASPLRAQLGDKRDKANTTQVDPIPIDKIPPQPVLSPEESLKAFKIQPGFHIELVASEPLIHDPIAIAFAPDGRIWVVEITSYMPNVDGIGEDNPIGKIVILESSKNDGHLDRRIVFADHLTLPRAVALVNGGVLVGEPPHLWFYPIVDGNKAGQRIEIARDFGSNYNPQNTANGLLWSLDNWIFCASYTTRFRSTEDGWQTKPTSRRGEWGISQDDYGRLVYNSNEDQFRIDLVPQEYIARNPNYHHAFGLNVDPIHDQTVWPIHMTPGVNRGYWKNILRPDGTLAKTTAACGPLIYRGDNFPPEYHGNAFVCEPAGNLVMRDILIESNGIMTGHQAYAHEEFLASTDERFRPVSLYNGPDGAMYMVDFHRGALEHRLSVTSYLRKQIKARALEEPLHMGRIYRITYGTNVPVRATLEDLTSPQLVEKIASPNGWIQDTAQRLLVERASPSAVAPLKKQALEAANPVTQVHSAWTLDGMGQMDKETLFALLASPQPKVRANAVRLTEASLRGPQAPEYLGKLLPMAQTDSDPDVQLQLAFSFGQTTASEARKGLLTIANRSSRQLVREAIVTSLAQRETEFAQELVHDWKDEQPGRNDLLQLLAECIVSSRNTTNIASILETVAAGPKWQQTAVLEGMDARVHEKNRKIYFTAEPSGLAKISEDKKLSPQIRKLSQLLTWPKQPGYVPPPVVPPLTADEQKSYDLGKGLFNATCAACHQPTGLGAGGIAPPLVGSEWVLGAKERLVRIVLGGVQGPIVAADVHFDSTMPSWATFKDEELAGILTYIRRDWDQGASPITANSVKAIRAEAAKHDGAWTSKELLKIK